MASKSRNRAEVIGNLGKDPEVRYTAAGDAVTTVYVATSEKWKDKGTGEDKERTEWHRIVLFKKLATVAAEYLRKGSHVSFVGTLRTHQWTDKDGINRYTTEIRVENNGEMIMLDKRPDNESKTTESEPQIPPQDQQPEPSSYEDVDI